MSRKVKVAKGDNFLSISIVAYGSPLYAINIQRANPQAKEPLSIGSWLTLPDLTSDPDSIPKSKEAQSTEEVTLTVEGSNFNNWTDITITRALDNFDTVTFNAPITIEGDSTRSVFTPLGFQPVEIFVGGEILFAGTIVEISPSLSENGTAVTIGAYSKPAVLGSCHLPVSTFPFQFQDNMTLEQIVIWVGDRFGIGAVFDKSSGGAFPDKVKCGTTQKVLDFLVELAKQQGFIIGNTPAGEMHFRKLDQNENELPVALLVQGKAPLVNATITFNHTQYYSQISGIKPTNIGSKGSHYTEVNNNLAGVIRPFNIEVTDTGTGDVQGATKAALGRMYGNCIAVDIEVATWRDESGNLWKPNTRINLEVPGAFIYSETPFIIRNVTLNKTAESETANLRLVLPDAFSESFGGKLPWE